MLRLIIYFLSFLKLLFLGKWYPPAHVRDVSGSEFVQLAELVANLAERLEQAERQTEATRKKVYRDEVKKDGETPVILEPKAEQQVDDRLTRLSQLNAGDYVPEDLL